MSRNLFYIVTGLTFLVTPFFSIGQDSTASNVYIFVDTLPAKKTLIRGTIKDDAGNPRPGITIYLREKKLATITDAEGAFSMPADSNETVIISGIGIAPLTLKAKENYVSDRGLQVSTRWAVTDPNNTVLKNKNIQVFPLPFPVPSASYELPVSYFNAIKNLGAADAYLRRGLETYGYDEKRYYHLDNGFALVTQMEQTNRDGYSLENEYRWSNKIHSDLNSPWNYLKALFSAPVGYYRVLVFLVSPDDLSPGNRNLSAEQARQWFSGGYLALPMAIKNLPFTTSHRVTLLVYQYQKEAGSNPAFLQPGLISGKLHFERSRIASVIK